MRSCAWVLLAATGTLVHHVATASPLGSGGIITNDNPDIVRHIFNTSGTFTALGPVFVQVAVLGGGGAGCGDACTYTIVYCVGVVGCVWGGKAPGQQGSHHRTDP